MNLFQQHYRIAETFDAAADAVIACEDSATFTRTLPDGIARLILSSPPYNIGKAYEKQVSMFFYQLAT